MSRGKRNRPLRTGVKRRQRERKAEAVVRFRYFSVTFHSYLFYIVSFVYRSLDNNVKAAVEGARVGLVEEVEEEVREARMDLLQEEKLLVFKRSKNAPQVTICHLF